jgi:hypothetical protein
MSINRLGRLCCLIVVRRRLVAQDLFGALCVNFEPERGKPGHAVAGSEPQGTHPAD